MTDDAPPVQISWVALGGASVTLFLFIVGVAFKLNSDISTVTSSERLHYEAVDGRLKELRDTFSQGRTERMNVDSGLASRIDDLNRVLGDLQRQLSQLEGKLGENLVPQR